MLQIYIFAETIQFHKVPFSSILFSRFKRSLGYDNAVQRVVSGYLRTKFGLECMQNIIS